MLHRGRGAKYLHLRQQAKPGAISYGEGIGALEKALEVLHAVGAAAKALGKASCPTSWPCRATDYRLLAMLMAIAQQSKGICIRAVRNMGGNEKKVTFKKLKTRILMRVRFFSFHEIQSSRTGQRLLSEKVSEK